MIATGTPVFCGHKLPITSAGKDYYHLFATHFLHGMDQLQDTEDRIMKIASLRLQGCGAPVYPWETLEQPSMAFYYGSLPGTIHLNYWVNLSSQVPKNNDGLLDLDIKPREITLAVIIERLIRLESGMEEAYEDVNHRNKYKNLFRIQEKLRAPQKTMDRQINDLVKDLSRQCWIDFSQKENHVVAKFFVNATYSDNGQYKLFFHQLLLAMELELRIQKYGEETKTDLFRNLPEKVKWDLALAIRWRSSISVEGYKQDALQKRIQFHLHKKQDQLKNLYTFAEILKWPNLPSLAPVFSNPPAEIENISADTMSYFSSVTLPGPTSSFLLMNSLIEIDSLSSSQSLVALTHLYTNIGFQYRGATFWNSNCIVGKVLAPSCREIGGWVGPIRPAEGLELTQVARVYQKKPKRRLEDVDVVSMNERSLPLGPVAKNYPMKDYALLRPNNDPDFIVDTIRIEKLSLGPVIPWDSMSEGERLKPRIFHAGVQVAVDGSSWNFRLAYDVSFVSASHCKGGPHPSFFDYEHQIVTIDGILGIKSWAGRNLKGVWRSGTTLEDNSRNLSTQLDASPSGSKTSKGSETGDEKVLVVEAFGVADNEVLARAWCANSGLSALVADVQKTCMACAIREAYAACLNLLILIDGSYATDDDD
ncbi:hypothetical protein K3495_g752 [Podosphaera aphanis]|nr:hypothetical protein K3495_g752 [Podosphaera aphanis]